jgi:alpha-ketoglutarate-dependent taurine dioxygenase
LEVHGDRIHIAFRSDTVARVSIDPRIVETFETIKAFLADPHNQISFKLQPHQILIFDNTRMLHGRTGFPLTEKRRINGLWFDGKGNFSNPLSFGILPSPSSQKVRQVALTKG